MRDRIGIRGAVTVQVFDQHGKVRRHSPGFLRRLFGLPGKFIVQEYHNIVTREGDALIADALLPIPTKTKVQNFNNKKGCIQVGTGWTGNSTKSNTRCNTPVGTPKLIDYNYPVLRASWGNIGDTTLLYCATFEQGSLCDNGINEACLLNDNTEAAYCLAYAQLSPAVNVGSNDTLQIIWEITILGQ
jgi:hypothetical protein